MRNNLVQRFTQRHICSFSNAKINLIFEDGIVSADEDVQSEHKIIDQHKYTREQTERITGCSEENKNLFKRCSG